MSRTKAREIALHLVFEMSFREFEAEEILTDRLDQAILQSISGDIALYAGKLSDRQIAYIMQVVKGVAGHLQELTMAVLRLALYEMKYMEDVPVGAAINEAVELAKTYETEDAGSFVNGILGTVGRSMAAESK